MGIQPKVKSPNFGLSTVESKFNHIVDFISGEGIKAMLEEVEALQVYARRLFEDYGYERSQGQTHPQFPVCMHPSDEEKSCL